MLFKVFCLVVVVVCVEFFVLPISVLVPAVFLRHVSQKNVPGRGGRETKSPMVVHKHHSIR